MCSEFISLPAPEIIAADLDTLVFPSDYPAEARHIRLYDPVPVLVQREQRLSIEEFKFSLKPPGTPYPTFNARLLSWDERRQQMIPIYDKPTWRKPLQQSRCLVPLRAFIEPVYLREHAGKMMEFSRTDGRILYGAGIYDETVDKKTGEIYQGLALVLTTPSDFVLRVGHHRQPLFLKASAARAWLSESEMNPQDAMDILLHESEEPPLHAEVNRPMAKGWEKRIADSERKLAREQEFMRHLDAHP